MTPRVLVVGELVDVAHSPKRHYSLTKGIELAKALCSHAEVDYLTCGAPSSDGLLVLRPIDRLPALGSYAAIVLMRETNLMEVIGRVPGLAALLVDRTRSTTVVARGDTFAWMGRRSLHAEYRRATGRSFVRDVPTMFDVVCAQTPELVRWSNARLPWRMRWALRGRAFVSPMGVPAVNHRVHRPRPHMPAGSPVELIYMGRLKTDRGRVIDLLCQVMSELGADYRLNVYPGSFVLPGAPSVVHRSDQPASIELLRHEFARARNVTVHDPFESADKVEVVSRHLIGIDVSPSRPHDRRFRAGNAKLLEYCWLGLLVVTEANVHNSSLVDECGNGIRLSGVASPAEFAAAVRALAERARTGRVDPAAIAQRVIDGHGWPDIAAALAARIGL